MYDVPKEYRAAIRSPTRSDRMAGKLTLTDGSTIELTDSAVISGSVSVDNQCVSGQELAFGSVYMGQASLQLRTALSSAAFYDAALQIDYEIQLADGSWYTLPVGRYTVAEAERSAAGLLQGELPARTWASCPAPKKSTPSAISASATPLFRRTHKTPCTHGWRNTNENFSRCHGRR